MRLPTGTDQGSRFRQQGRKDGARLGERGTLRRLFRLVIALVLVIVVMDTAGDPEIYRPFFGDQQSTVSTQSALLQQTSPQAGQSRTSESNAWAPPHDGDAFPGPDLIDFGRQLVPLLSGQEQTTLTGLLAWQRRPNETALQRLDPQSGDAEAVIDSVEQKAESLRTGLSDDAPLSGIAERCARSLRSILAAANDGNGEETSRRTQDLSLDLTAEQSLLLKALQYALDETYQQKVVDGAVWSGEDADAFYRYLERAAAPDFLARPSDQEAPPGLRPARIGVVPLIQQSTIYQGRMVRIDGTVARASRIDAKENPFGVRRYWELWIRPADGTERPVVLYAPEVSKRIAVVGPDAALNRGPEISAVGFFLKRRLFPAASGPEQAPVIVGRAIDASATPRQTTLPAAPANGPPVWLLVVIAAVIGIVAAGWLSWQATTSAKRSRERRRKAERPPVILTEGNESNARTAAARNSSREERSGEANDLPPS